MKFLEGIKPIKFDEAKHKYYTDQGKELISVSTLVKLYSRPFDSTGEIIIRCAQKQGITPEELRKEWDFERDSASERGTKLHKEMEHWMDTGKIDKKGEFKDVVKQIKEMKLEGKLLSETILYDVKMGIAGTADVVQDLGGFRCRLWDFKTNKKLKKQSFFNRNEGGYAMMLPPISHIMDSNYFHYSLQLQIYSLLLEQYGYWVESATLLHLNPKTNLIEPHSIQYLRKEAVDIINHYNSVLA